MASLGEDTVQPGTVSFADLGIPQPPKLQDTLLGKARHFKDLEKWERAYIFACVVTLAATFALTLYKISTVSSSDSDFTFALVLLVSTLFSVYYSLHGVLQERATELLVLCVAMLVVVIYLIINYSTGKQDDVKLVRLIVAAVLCPPLVAMGMYLGIGYYRSGNLIFRTVGANTQLQDMCRLIFVFFDLLKFDMQLSISMVIFILTSRLHVDTEDIVVLSVGGVLTIFWFLLTYDSMKRENKLGALFFFMLSPLEIAYVIYKLHQTAENDMTNFTSLANSTIACGVMALIVRVCVIIVGGFAYRNFNKGLKQKAFGYSPDETTQVQSDHPETIP